MPFMPFGGFGGGFPTENSSVPPEERYKDQLEKMAEMGFTNKEANIQALQATGGNVEMALERLFSMMGR
jgi:ubiquilin